MKNSLGMLLLILLVGCEKTIERVVVENKPGLSAYELAVNNGFLGTEQQWLASLVGAPGAPGQDGLDAAQITPILLCATSNEYALKINGALYAVYVNRVNQLTYLAKLAVGNYITTDGTNCAFTVNADGTTTTTGTGTLPGGPTLPPVQPLYQFKITHNNGRVIYLKNVGLDTFEAYNEANLKVCNQKPGELHMTICTTSGIVVNNRGNHVVVDACNVNNTLNYSVGQTLVDNGSIKCIVERF